MLLVSVWTPLHNPQVSARWFSAPRVYFIWLFPVLGAVAFVMLLRAISQRRDGSPFLWGVLLFLSAYVGLQAAVYPNAVLPDVTIYEAAAQAKTSCSPFGGSWWCCRRCWRTPLTAIGCSEGR